MNEELIAGEGYIGKAGDVRIVEEWKEIVFKGEEVKVGEQELNRFVKDKEGGEYRPTYTFKNRLGYANVEIDGCPWKVLVVSPKVFPDLWEKIKNDPKTLHEEFEKTFQAYLQDLYDKATSLPFEIRSETAWPGEEGYAPANLFWQALFLSIHKDEISDALRFIIARPHSSLIGEPRWVRQDQARRFTPNALVAALTRSGNVGLIENSPVFLKFPDTVPRETFDNPENQFARFVVGNWVDDITRIKGAFGQEKTSTLTRLEGTLTEALFSSPLSDAGAFTGIPSTSTVLAKAPGYREIRSLWADYQRAKAIFPNLNEAIDLKQIDVIWEYWVLFKMIETLHEALSGGAETFEITITGDAEWGIVFEFGEQNKLHYNKQCKTHPGVYSCIPLRPDFLLEMGNHRYVFDAKFRIEETILEKDEEKEQKDIAEEMMDYEKDEAEKELRAIAKSADLVKMHAYRDAIEGVQGAFVLYPGYEDAIFPYGDKITKELASKLSNKIYGGFEGFLQAILKWPHFRGVGFFGVRRKENGQEKEIPTD